MKEFDSTFTVLSSSEIEEARRDYRHRQTTTICTGVMVTFLSVLSCLHPQLKPFLQNSQFLSMTIILLFFVGFISLVMLISIKEDTLKTLTPEQCRELEGYVREHEEIRKAVERIFEKRRYVIYREFVLLKGRAREYQNDSDDYSAFRSLQEAVRRTSKKTG